METKKVIFGDITPSEIENFEKKINGLIIHNSTGLNSLMFSPSNNCLVIQADKIEDKEKSDYPNLIFLSETDIVRLFNYLSDFCNNRPDIFQFKNQQN